MKVIIEAATADDEPFLWRMLAFAASMGTDGPEQVAAVQSDPYLRTYVADWKKKPGDVGVIARDQTGDPVGAAWLRLGNSDGGAFKLGDERIPELATAVVPHARAQGVGTVMMRRLIEDVKPLYSRIVLSVRESNPAVGFYTRLGFAETARMKNRVGGDSIVMTFVLWKP